MNTSAGAPLAELADLEQNWFVLDDGTVNWIELDRAQQLADQARNERRRQLSCAYCRKIVDVSKPLPPDAYWKCYGCDRLFNR